MYIIYVPCTHKYTTCSRHIISLCVQVKNREYAGYKPDIDPGNLWVSGTISGLYPKFKVFNRLKIYLGRFSNKIVSTLKTLGRDFSRFLHKLNPGL